MNIALKSWLCIVGQKRLRPWVMRNVKIKFKIIKFIVVGIQHQMYNTKTTTYYPISNKANTVAALR